MVEWVKAVDQPSPAWREAEGYIEAGYVDPTYVAASEQVKWVKANEPPEPNWSEPHGNE